MPMMYQGIGAAQVFVSPTSSSNAPGALARLGAVPAVNGQRHVSTFIGIPPITIEKGLRIVLNGNYEIMIDDISIHDGKTEIAWVVLKNFFFVPLAIYGIMTVTGFVSTAFIVDDVKDVLVGEEVPPNAPARTGLFSALGDLKWVLLLGIGLYAYTQWRRR